MGHNLGLKTAIIWALQNLEQHGYGGQLKNVSFNLIITWQSVHFGQTPTFFGEGNNGAPGDCKAKSIFSFLECSRDGKGTSVNNDWFSLHAS